MTSRARDPNLSRERFMRWIADYERAWRTPGTDSLGTLFAAGATYRTAPFEPPLRGLDQIAEMWEAERDGPEEHFVMESEVVAVDAATGVARLEVRYGDPVARRYRDLWIVAFDAAEVCVTFEEWPFWPSGTEGEFRAGPGA